MNDITNPEVPVYKKKKYLKGAIFLTLFFGILLICSILISYVRNGMIKDGVYFGINLGMEKEEVKERLMIRSKGFDKISLEDEDNIYTFQNFHFLNDPNFYVNEAYMFQENKLKVIFITITCLDTSWADKMQKDSIEKMVELYGNFEQIGNFRTWKKGATSIRMINNNPTGQILNVIISDLPGKQ